MPALVLASSSATRARLLRDAGVAFEAIPARVDEASVKDGMRAEEAPASDAAQALADLKAMRLSPSLPETLVIGADQILECDGVWFDKPADLGAAREQLTALSGRTHQLWTAAAVAKDGSILWRDMARARLTMRALSPAFIDDYLAAVGETALHSVGAYQVEGRGIQLFAAISGDFFSILGLPLLTLLDFLRGHRVVPA
jgi:septum formation protein